MLRFIETGDLKRLMRLKMRLAQLEAEISILREKKDLANAAEELVRLAKVAPAKFRRSYRFEGWVEELLTGHIRRSIFQSPDQLIS
jgi:hypothetical protein